MNSLSGGTSLVGGYTRLCKGLAVVLIAAHLLLQIFPVSLTYLALIPARTIPFAWNLVTAGYVEQTIYGLAVSTGIPEVHLCRQLFYFTVCFCDCHNLLLRHSRGSVPVYATFWFHGVLSGFLVGIKQIFSDQELPFLKFQGKGNLPSFGQWLPSIVLLLTGISSFFIAEPVKYLPTLFFGTYTGWIYLRYWQKKPETKFRGDPSDEFSFSFIFPGVPKACYRSRGNDILGVCSVESAKLSQSLTIMTWGQPNCLDQTLSSI
ncbi:hypothetical protein MLD38_018981 [Melastoma candidum]|uniref:Uncharacterized protein n=1 Tax=Melastoma candidum TaxID=119954 RepID=A0ACB9QYM5_9MYRT|nr:hypothetical protein MLD38_018981 [Melastoma candidum]